MFNILNDNESIIYLDVSGNEATIKIQIAKKENGFMNYIKQFINYIKSLF